MAVKISGVLKDGTGKPVQNCTIQLKAKRNSTTVVVNTLASENPDEAGRYSMDVEYGQYSVILWIEGSQPSHAGTITVYEDSKPGTLNDFLGAMTEDDARPEALRRFELMVEEVARNAASASQDADAANKSASDASASAGQAALSAQEASSSAGTASTKATEASESAAAAEASKNAAATGAEAAKTSETNAASSQQLAAESASVAGEKVLQAENHALSAKESQVAAERAAESAISASQNAAVDAATATAAQLRDDIREEIDRASVLAERAEAANDGARQALDEAREIAKTPGPKGDTGPQGEQGPQGERGPKGDTGPQGESFSPEGVLKTTPMGSDFNDIGMGNYAFPLLAQENISAAGVSNHPIPGSTGTASRGVLWTIPPS